MSEYADCTNDGDRGGDDLFRREGHSSKEQKTGLERKPTVDFRDGWSADEVYADFLENGFR